ncbi:MULTISPECIES: hypothetical protein [Paenibacillus]|uniref:hypothetical protein n=1 Tax=Paenibacillus TaxID=44249 RepID=UPI000B00E4E0|nr:MULTISPECIES: hypothetical protein [Paenibacillus]
MLENGLMEKARSIPDCSRDPSGPCSEAEGSHTTASGKASHAEGSGTTAAGKAAHSSGCGTQSIADIAHAETVGNVASGSATHAEKRPRPAAVPAFFCISLELQQPIELGVGQPGSAS